MKRRNFIMNITAAVGGLIATKAIAKLDHSSMSDMVCDVKSDNCDKGDNMHDHMNMNMNCLLYTSPSPRD